MNKQKLKTYLVGGAVRDQLLNLPIIERDWVVVGSTPEALLDQGYKPVGKDFPVFLHPETHEEYALARTERKVSKGYKGFTFYADPDVTLEQDLIRRDLTINAIAKDKNGELVDPFNGQADLNHKILRHVSEAFAEDPVRILRAARFAAKLPEFSIHPDTVALMQKMTAAGEVNALVAERVWQEFSKTLNEPAPWRFFEILDLANALDIVFAEIDFNAKLKTILEDCCTITENPLLRFACLWSDISPEDLKTFNKRIRLPKEYFELALLVAKFFGDYKNTVDKSAKALLELIQHLDAFRRPERFLNWLKVCQVCAAGKADSDAIYLRLTKTFEAASKVDYSVFVDQGIKGKAFAEALYQLRLKAIQKIY